jgi:CRP-like cAMP-binding protein
MDDAAIQTVRQMPLFAGLTDDQLGCIENGDIIDLPVGAVLATEGEKSEHFYLTLAGEMQLWKS